MGNERTEKGTLTQPLTFIVRSLFPLESISTLSVESICSISPSTSAKQNAPGRATTKTLSGLLLNIPPIQSVCM